MNKDKPPKSSKADMLKTFASARRVLAFAYKAHPAFFIGSVLSIFSSAALPLLDAYIYAQVFDSLIKTVTETKAIGPDLINNIIFLLITSVLFDFAGKLSTYFDWNLYEILSNKYNEEFSRKMANLDFEYYDTPEVSGLINKVTHRYMSFNLNFMRRIFEIVEALFAIILNISILLTLSPIIIVVSIVATIPQTISSVYLTKLRYKIFDEWTDRRKDSGRTRSKIVNDESIKEIKTFNLIDYFVNRFISIDIANSKAVMKVENKRLLLNSIWGILDSITFGLVLIILTTTVLAGRITVGALTFYVRSASSLRANIGRLFNRLTLAYESGLYVNDYYKLMDLEKKIVSGGTVLLNKPIPPKIEFVNVGFKYPVSEKWVLRNINLKIYPSENIAIVGENGAGKTTLIKLLMRFYDTTEGEILIDGINIKGLNTDDWYSKVGTLFQEYNFYHFDAKTNIGVGKISDIENIDKIVDSAQKSGANEFIEKYEDKYDQILDKAFKGGINPSTGQKQKIALARAFFKNAPILILDEPTSSIDAKAEFEIFENLFKFAEKKTVIIISHRFSTVRNAQRIIVLDDGKIIEEGAHEDLIKIEDGKYKKAFELQKKGYE